MEVASLPALTPAATNMPLASALEPANRDSCTNGTTWLDRVGQKREFEKLGIAEQCKRELFVREYLYDFNAHNAACRAGIPDHIASQWSSSVMREPWVRNRLKEVIEEVDEKVVVSRNRIMFGLLEEAQRIGMDSSHAARVAAWDKLATIAGMKIEKQSHEHTFKGGVMVVPATGSVDTWSDQASASQARLKDDVRS